MTTTIHLQSELRGSICLPASKSISARALLLAALAQGSDTPTGEAIKLRGLSNSQDTTAMQQALADRTGNIDVGAAGTAMRFMTAYLAQQPATCVLTGTKRMQQRPIGILVGALRSLGADISYLKNEGFPPLLIKGKRLRSGTLRLNASISSQYVSALLMIAPTLPQGLTLRLDGTVASRPYIDMTLELMRQFGAEACWTADNIVYVEPARYAVPEGFVVEADWSAASYWYEMVALSPDAEARLLLQNLKPDSLQGDCRVAEIFRQLGVKTEFTPDGAVITKAPATNAPLALDLSGQPDLAQTLIVTCAMLRRPFTFSGLASLRIKETDRTAALQAELQKLGCRLEPIGDDVARFLPTSEMPQENPCISTYDDHRMAMAFAPCAYRFPGLAIADPGVVGKSYPDFWKDMANFAQLK